MSESMGQRIEARLLDGRGNLRPLCGNGLGRQASGDSHAVRVIALDGDKWKNFADIGKVRKGGCGFGIDEREVMYTLSCSMRHIAAIIPASTFNRQNPTTKSFAIFQPSHKHQALSTKH